MKRALLFSGGENPKKNKPRYLNNLSAFYKVLRQHSYNKNEIVVCSATGGEHDFDDDNTDETYTRGDRRQLTEHLRWLASTTKGDTIVFVASNHGNENGISLWGTDFVTPQEMNETFRYCEATKIFIFGQCNSGIFGLGLKLSDTVVCCACGEG